MMGTGQSEHGSSAGGARMVRREAVRARSYCKLVGVLVQKVNRSRLRTIGYRHVGSAACSAGPDDASDGWMRREREIG
jgi:hypothetical protein